ncbi:DUF211 domain-containing protein [Haloplanus aerogenes]|uniref:DUF211 domain-containing protein n=1 Tax=Haloplanus aerogenes TaxID=660522 RepID=A0A3M0DSN5_9EURY|nr:DUF211 domain-containing protein [Haloplanus aerogenes]AZH26184.1 hypothetical protein DU502_12795 [Haloplanus aerogenes]RMB18363.1 hypothetical protein ATH50_1817 [Haloplanus aerogenes]
MATVRRLVLDVLKPHDPPLVDFADRVAETDGVEGVTVSLIEHDREVQNVEVTLDGAALDVASIEETIEQLGGTIHSVDLVACGEYVVGDRPPSRDR